ncbi:carboxypeptidase Y [Dactylonectria macrodidyma]|uniref:Carboxypeptidase Y n=1 Tax=Dactylonectria macrodidyma TaxID=307937 RepID=A0A9P9FGI4_9HYPO|nr:carboxypeptidase Y [Dactylonectria macrodidyma]
MVEQDENFSIREQGPELCDAGSRHWTGSVNITKDKSMFFWYFESRNAPETDPVVLWMSGGPGATGEFGIFQDSGPCHVNEDGNSTTRQPFAWTDAANVLFIDQPVGVGFSTVASSDQTPVDLRAGARDLYAFLEIFTSSVFPDLANRPWHISGESMGGHYTTGYVKYIVQQQHEREGRGLRLDIKSIIAVDAYIDATRQSAGYYEFFCTGDQPRINETACAHMASAVPHCEALGEKCRSTYDVDICLLAAEVCDSTVGKYFLADVKPGGWDPYDARHPCTEPPLCGVANNATEHFLNQGWVQERLGFAPFDFKLIDFDINDAWTVDRHVFVPTTRELTWLLDNTDINIVFINGNEDIIISTPGQIRMLNEQPWHGQAWFRAQGLQPWYYQDGEVSSEGSIGGEWKGNRRLSLFTVNEAGHMAPYNQPEAVGAILKQWIRQ